MWAVGCKVRSHPRRRSFLPQNPRWPPFSLGWPPPLLPLQLPSIASSSLDLPPRSKDREEEEHVELKRKRGSRRCSTPSLLVDFLGETLGKDKILLSLVERLKSSEATLSILSEEVHRMKKAEDRQLKDAKHIANLEYVKGK